MEQNILTLSEVAERISGGKTLLLAGDERLLAQLPKGNWIGGSIPYFVAPLQGGMVSREVIFSTDISDLAASVEIKAYDENGLGQVYCEGGENGFSVIIIPALSEAHHSFAVNAPNYKNFGAKPLVGWVAGVHLDDLGKISPKVFNGKTGTVNTQNAVVMHVALAPGKAVDVGIMNIFDQGDGDILTFRQDGFTAREVVVNGVAENFAVYIARKGLDTKLPLVADYYGAKVNVSFQSAGDKDGVVKFYAPVFSGVRYKHARPVEDYAKTFADEMAKLGVSDKKVIFSCNCILNFLYLGLEGKDTAPFVGPVTFGEIAYQLLNQTLVYIQAD
ncbi:MAG: hypothetical protein AUJ49_09750 [Desulfovibrionaceae bacterium CG1_02_65_16]|nr:MAG: hypothetical protein AUJ49_09750 [Desulfovibrionaceae bacterium CG1_02_65_16]